MLRSSKKEANQLNQEIDRLNEELRLRDQKINQQIEDHKEEWAEIYGN